MKESAMRFLTLFVAVHTSVLPAVTRESGVRLQRATAGQEQRFRDVFAVVQQGISDNAFPGAVLAVGYKGKLVALKSFGHFDYSPKSRAVHVNALWDIASCSKVVATTTAVAILVEQVKIDLDAPVIRYIPEFASSKQTAPAEERDSITVRHLMTHSSGLPSGARLYSGLADRGKKDEMLLRVNMVPLISPPGAKMIYSDLSMLLMQQIVESVSGMPLDRFLLQKVFARLHMKSTMYNPPQSMLGRTPPMEDDHRLRNRVIRGEVHDENSWMMGGVAGHAGLFSTAQDLSVFEQMMLNGGIYGKTRILKTSTVEAFIRRQDLTPGSSRAIGWDTPSENSSAGQYLSPRAFGHTGFTGTSIWADPDKQLFIILLTNRVHPSRTNMGIAKVRPAVADAVVKALGLAAN
jgi:CubicO group peptidase (beta-lactamase class C family)